MINYNLIKNNEKMLKLDKDKDQIDKVFINKHVEALECNFINCTFVYCTLVFNH